MKRFLIPFLAVIALPTFAGDLGSADFKEALNNSNSSEKNDRSQDFGIMRCGWLAQTVDCDVKFKDGRLVVGDSKGITKDQITQLSMSSDKFLKELHIFYRDSEGIINQASISKKINKVKDFQRWHRFIKEFLYFLNQENKSIPNNYF